MKSTFFKAVFAAILAATAFSASATVIDETLANATGPDDGTSLVRQFNSPGAGAGLLTFDIKGLVTLDGENCCTDIFTLAINGVTLFSGTFDMGGGGNNVVYFTTPGVTVVSTETYGLYEGGLTRFSVTHALLAGMNSYSFTYSPLQGREDEGWKLQNAHVSGEVSSSNVPEPGSLALLGLALAGIGAARRRKN